MPITTAYETQIDHVSILDEDGVFDETLGQDVIPEDQLPAIMEHLVFCRQLDETAFKLRSGRMGTSSKHWPRNAFLPPPWPSTKPTGWSPVTARTQACSGMGCPQNASCCTGWAMNAATIFLLV